MTLLEDQPAGGARQEDKLLALMKPLDVEAFAWQHANDITLDPDTVATLSYMARVELATEVYQRTLCTTRAAHDPYVSAFLGAWLHEELPHGELFTRLLAHQGHAVQDERQTWGMRLTLLRGRVLNTAMARIFRQHFFAVHMAWGAVNEQSTLQGYLELARRTEHPLLRDVLAAIIKQERRHYAFYSTMAKRQLDASAFSRRLTRFALARFWTPVGVGVRPRHEAEAVIRHLFPHGSTSAADIDRRVDDLPGCDGLGLLDKAARRAWAAAA